MSCCGFRAGGFGNLDGHAEKRDVIRRSRSALPHGAARSSSADHGETVFPPLYSGCTARQGRVIECCTRPLDSFTIPWH